MVCLVVSRLIRPFGQDTFTFIVLLSAQCVQMGTSDLLMLGVTLRWTSIPSRESRNYTLSGFML